MATTAEGAQGTGLDATFRISERGSTVRTEVLGGVTTFLAMAYILFVNPAILGGEGGLPFTAVLTVTALTAGVMTIAMGVFAHQPIGMAAGLGLNTFVAVTLVGQFDLPWPQAMGIVVLEGVLVTILVLSGLRQRLLSAVPLDLKRAMAIGIGAFIAYVGLNNGGFLKVASGDTQNLQRVLVFVIGLVLTAVLVARKQKGALLIGIVVSTFIAMLVRAVAGGFTGAEAGMPSTLISSPDFSLVGDVDLFGAFSSLPFLTVITLTVALMLADFFDSFGTIVGVSSLSGAMDEKGRMPGLKPVLLIDSLGAVVGGAASSSSNTAFIESAAGVSDGARTGLASVVTGILFLATLFFSPLAAVVPPEATAPALVVVGFLMMPMVAEIDWRDAGIGIPALLMIIVMPLTQSIAAGIGAGFIGYVAIALVRGRGHKVHWLLYLIAAVFVWYFASGLVA